MHEKVYLKSIKYFNLLLTSIILVLAIWLAIEPLIPEIAYRFKSYTGNYDYSKPGPFNNPITYHESNASGVLPTADSNSLIIPSIHLTTSVQQLASIEDLHTGSWLRPETSSPEKGSNTVIVAHRYTSIGGLTENTFYHLPKVQIGDAIYVDWLGNRYEYEVYNTKVVDPDNSEVEGPTTGSELTLYTCTPLWTSTQRFVVNSKLISIDGVPLQNNHD